MWHIVKRHVSTSLQHKSATFASLKNREIFLTSRV